MIIDFKVIPHDQQRYETVGDWWWSEWCAVEGIHVCSADNDHPRPPLLSIRVSKMSDPRFELLVFHHELTEALLCREAGVTTEMVDEWDKNYEACRETKTPLECGCEMRDEPGDDPHCPCFKQHRIATQQERIMAKALGVKWATYDAEVESL